MAQGVYPEESPYAREGTAAHALAELKASFSFGKIDERLYHSRRNHWREEYEIDDITELEMDEHTDAYVELLHERMELYPNSVLMLEQKLDTGVPKCWGTSDTVIVSPLHVEIIDFKYGSGVMVTAKKNPQTRLYAIGALENIAELLGDVELVRITIHQPRMENLDTEELTPTELRTWRDSILPVAEEALGDDAHFGPSASACRWCPASGRCKAEMEEVFKTEFDVTPDTMSPEKVSETLARVDFVRQWLTSFEETALTMAYAEGQEIPGYKVVLSGGIRKIQDEEKVIKVLEDAGYTFDEVAKTKVRGIGELEKLLGKEKFAELLNSHIRKTDGRPSLVSEDDSRPPISPDTEAAKDFS